jgi:hypothetical protein
MEVLRDKHQLIQDLEAHSAPYKSTDGIRIDIKSSKVERTNTLTLDSKKNTPRAGDSIQSAVIPQSIQILYTNKPSTSQGVKEGCAHKKSKTPMEDDSPGYKGNSHAFTKLHKINKKTALLNIAMQSEPMTEKVNFGAQMINMKFRPISVIDTPTIDLNSTISATASLMNQRKQNTSAIGGSRRRNIETSLHLQDPHLNFTGSSTHPSKTRSRIA